MNINIREYIKNNFKENNDDDIKDAIISSVNDKDEVTLPGLGVFFEILWENSLEEEKDKFVKTIKENLN